MRSSKLVGRALLLQAPDALPQNPSDSAFRAASSPFRGAKGSEAFGAYVETQKLPTTAAPKSPSQYVSYSEAASGLLTSSQGTDARANLSGSWYSVRL